MCPYQTVRIPRNPTHSLPSQIRLLHKHGGPRLHRPDGRVRGGRRPQRDGHGQDRHAAVRVLAKGPQAREPPRPHRLREPAHPRGAAAVRLVAAGRAALCRPCRRERARGRGDGAHAGMVFLLSYVFGSPTYLLLYTPPRLSILCGVGGRDWRDEADSVSRLAATQHISRGRLHGRRLVCHRRVDAASLRAGCLPASGGHFAQ